MMYLILGIVLGLCFFIATIKAYTIGLSHGKQLSNGTVPKVNLNPVKPIIQAVQTHQKEKEAEKVTDELEEVLGYDYNTALKAVKSSV